MLPTHSGQPPLEEGSLFAPAPTEIGSPQSVEGTTADAGGLIALIGPFAVVLGSVCGGPKKCIAQQGDVACPAGFGNKTLVGTGANAKCDVCPDCKADVQCTGTLSFFTNQQCTSGQIDMTADSQCVNRPVNSGGVGSVAYKYKGSVKSATCTPTGDTKGATVLEGQTTICCAN